MASKTSLLRPGDVVGGFEVEDLIGIGGMATVYRAEQLSLGRPVALKILAKQFTGDQAFRERFRREGMHAASLEHPNIVPVYDSGEQDDLLYLAMRLVDGSSLAELLGSTGVSADQAIAILAPVASALDCAHAAGLIHRDVKPQNILITSQGHPYLADFGVAKSANASGLTATGGFVGSVNYASPEQIKGLTLTPASDVYALTAVLYHCLAGTVPFPHDSEAGVMHSHLHDPPPTLPALEGADSEFHSVFARGMAKDSGSRYGHAGDLLNAAAVAVSRMPSARRKSVPAFPKQAGGETEKREALAPAAPIAAAQPGSMTRADQRRAPAPPEEPPKTKRSIRSRLPSLPSLPSAPSRAKAPSAPSRNTLIALGAVGGIAVIVALVAILAGGGDDGPSTETVRRGPVELSYPGAWRLASAKRTPATYGLRFGSPVALHDGQTTLVAGRLENGAPVPGDQPPAFASRLDAKRSKSAGRLGGAAAVRYEATAPDGAALTLFVLPTATGDVGLLCRQRGAGSGAKACAEVASTLRLIGVESVPAGADTALAARLRNALRKASEERGAGAEYASSGATDVSAARQVAAIDTAAARQLAAMPAEPRDRPAVKDLATALRDEADALAAAAAAAKDRRYDDYAHAEKEIEAAGRDVAKAAVALRRIGFATVPALGALDVPPLHRPSPEPEPIVESGESEAPTEEEIPATESPPESNYVPPPTPEPPPSPPPPEHSTVPAQPLG